MKNKSIPRSYTSLPLDGAARNHPSFHPHGYTRSHNLSCLDLFTFSSSYARGEKEKLFGLSWNRTQILLLHKRPSYQFGQKSIFFTISSHRAAIAGIIKETWNVSNVFEGISACFVLFTKSRSANEPMGSTQT